LADRPNSAAGSRLVSGLPTVQMSASLAIRWASAQTARMWLERWRCFQM